MADLLDSEMFICQTCGKTYKWKCSLNKHRRAVHANQGIYHCCGKAYQDADHFRRHRANHHSGPKSYVCTKCGKSFATSHLLKAHQKNEMTEEEGLLRCNICDKKFARQYSLQEHLSTHNETPQHRCECGKLYKHMSSLSRHMQIHKRKD